MWKTTLKMVAAALVCGGCCCSSDCGAAEVVEEIVVVAPEAKGAMTAAAPAAAKETPAHQAAPAVSKPKSAEARKVGQKLVDNICKEDSKGFCHSLCDNMKKHFTSQHFTKGCKQLRDKMGKPVKGEFLAELAHPVFNISVWKMTFIKEVPGKKPEERQALFQVVTGEKDGKMQLLGFGFI
jgi:hypothetical protein